MVIANSNTNGVSSSRRNGSPSNSNGSGSNGSGYGTVPSDLYGIHSFPDGVDAHNFINAALNAGDHIGAVAAATRMSSRGMNFDTLLASNGPNGIANQIQSSFSSGFGNPVNIHPMPPPASVRRSPASSTRRSPCPASALIVFAEVHDPPRIGSPSPPLRTSSSFFGLLGNPSSQSSNSSFGSGNSCECEGCRCVCSFYCHEHAAVHCRVHGHGARGLSSGSDDPYPNSSQGSSDGDLFPPSPGSF
ncbi:unnamed protein product [Orchesella dallaii]|uniref:C2H2-type domain-containing protein n=1 Tax=Orchesella dallaii TaxID=48710 RepID=A0ABP1RNJ9_9HEXA